MDISNVTVIAHTYDAAALYSQSAYPTITAGQGVLIYINVKNTGTTTWSGTSGYGWNGIGYWGGGTFSFSTPPGQVDYISQTVHPPSSPGAYRYGLHLTHNGIPFGPDFFIDVTVVASAGGGSGGGTGGTPPGSCGPIPGPCSCITGPGGTCGGASGGTAGGGSGGAASNGAPYVALGDSYSAGEGLSPYGGTGTSDTLVDGKPDGCHRSENRSYPVMLSKTVRSLAHAEFWACSGAKTSDVGGPVSPGYPDGVGPQVSHLGTETKFVTLTIGGNDVGFVPLLQACITGEKPAKGHFGCTTDKKFDHEYADAIDETKKLRAKLVNVLSEVQQDAKIAQIYVGDYPKLFGDSFGKVQSQTVCEVGPNDLSRLTGHHWTVKSDAVENLKKFEDTLNGTIKAAVGEANTGHGNRIHFVEVTPLLVHHGLCDSDASWINGIVLDYSKLRDYVFAHRKLPENISDYVVGPQTGSFHPTADGQCAYEQAFQSAIAPPKLADIATLQFPPECAGERIAELSRSIESLVSGLKASRDSFLLNVKKGTIGHLRLYSTGYSSASITLASRPYRRVVRLHPGWNRIVLRVGRRFRPGRHHLVVTVRSGSVRQTYERTITVRK